MTHEDKKFRLLKQSFRKCNSTPILRKSLFSSLPLNERFQKKIFISKVFLFHCLFRFFPIFFFILKKIQERNKNWEKNKNYFGIANLVFYSNFDGRSESIVKILNKIINLNFWITMWLTIGNIWSYFYKQILWFNCILQTEFYHFETLNLVSVQLYAIYDTEWNV